MVYPRSMMNPCSTRVRYCESSLYNSEGGGFDELHLRQCGMIPLLKRNGVVGRRNRRCPVCVAAHRASDVGKCSAARARVDSVRCEVWIVTPTAAMLKAGEDQEPRNTAPHLRQYEGRTYTLVKIFNRPCRFFDYSSSIQRSYRTESARRTHRGQARWGSYTLYGLYGMGPD